MVKAPHRLRFAVPVNTVAEAACIVDVPVSTLATGAGYVRRSKGHTDVAGDRILTHRRTASTAIRPDQVLLPLTVSEPT